MSGKFILKFLFILLILPRETINAQSKTFSFYFKSGRKIPGNFNAFKDSVTKWKETYLLEVISVKGFADSIGSEAGNLRLSGKRAGKVNELISAMNIAINPQAVSAYGEKFPVTTNYNKQGRSRNRRVETTIKFTRIKTEVIIQPVTVNVPAKKECEERDTVIIFPEGTEIEIKGCSLDGMKISDIKVEAQEFFTQDKMLLNEMWTQTSDGSCLSTGGMIRMKITSKSGQPGKLKEGNDMIIRIPKIAKDSAYDLYDMEKGKGGEELGWKKRDEKVNYSKEKNKYEVKLSDPVAAINLDFLPKPFSGLASKKTIVKTRIVRKGNAHVSGNQSVLKLSRVKPRKFDMKNCRCLSENDQFVTVVAKKHGKIYYCHKPMSGLKKISYYRTKYIVRKRDYEVLADNKELTDRLKKDFARR